MWPALNFAADSLENFSTSPPCGEFEVLIADGALLARRSRPPEAGASDTGLKGDTFRELTSTKALRPPFAELSGVAVGSKDRWSTVADQSPEVVPGMIATPCGKGAVIRSHQMIEPRACVLFRRGTGRAPPLRSGRDRKTAGSCCEG
jgi:hypothetical protein